MRIRRQKLASWLLLAVGAGALIAGLALLLRPGPKPPAEPAVAANQSAAPDATKPTAKEISAYTVAADLPRYIYIPAIKVEQTRITHLGVDEHGQIRVPDNLNDTGWYKASAKPGQKGAMFIYGHISSWQAKGVFYDLHKLKAGDEVTIERGDGQKYTYVVVESKTYPADKVNMNEVLAPVDKTQPGLNLMTCAGTVKPGTSEFTERLVVFTTLKSS